MSSFIEPSRREDIDRRRGRQSFIERGLAARAEALYTGEYYDADKVLKELDEQLARADSSG